MCAVVVVRRHVTALCVEIRNMKANVCVVWPNTSLNFRPRFMLKAENRNVYICNIAGWILGFSEMEQL
jgi:hypothetical protein